MLKLRDLEYNDIPVCQTIVAANWGLLVAEHAGREMREMFRSNSQWPPHYYVVEDEQGIVGFAGFKSAWLMANAYELIWVNVLPSMQGKGIGRMLTARRMERIKELGGTLVLLMTQKIFFFAKFGFRAVANFDGWELMVNQLAPVNLDDRP